MQTELTKFLGYAILSKRKVAAVLSDVYTHQRTSARKPNHISPTAVSYAVIFFQNAKGNIGQTEQSFSGCSFTKML